MKSSPALPPDAEEQAALWAARLDGSTLSDTDRASLDLWLKADPAHRLLLTTYCQFSADLEQQLPLLAGIKDELADVSTTPKIAQLHPWLRRPVLAGVALIAAAAVAVVLWRDQPQNQFKHLSTPVAQRTEVTLDDGTHVELNAQTTLVVEFKAGERRVRLASGEAFFHVSKDADRPFFVETPAGSVRVTGTQFNVLTDASSHFEVTVLEGSVQVRPGTDQATRSLSAGEQLVRSAGHVGVQSLPPGALDGVLAWRQGQVIFNGTPLRDALATFARYHGRTLTASDGAALQRVGGRRSLDDLDGFLGALEGALPVRVIRESDGSIRVDELRL